MANFGKRAKLESQKSTVKVECLVSVYDTVRDEAGNPVRYRVVVQRLQDEVDVKDAEAGLADAMPWITNRRQWFYDEDGSCRVQYTHWDYVTEDMMAAIRRASKNCFLSRVRVEEPDGSTVEKEIENYCVKLDIGFNMAKGEAFFYRIKSGVNRDSLAKDIRYNLRHMPAEGRELTAAILEGHREITDIAARVRQDAAKLGQRPAPSEPADRKKEGDEGADPQKQA